MKRFFIFALVATVFAACSTDATQDLAPEIPTAPDELHVSFDAEDTRIQLGDNGTPVWTEGDLVSVFYKSNANQQWQFQGKTGDSEGTLKRVNAGTAIVAMEKVVAVYPYNENYLITPSSGNIEASLPAEQTYLADSYGLGSSPMISSGYYTQLSFKNVCGWLKLQFTGTGSIEKIVLRGNNREQVAGNIYICADDASCVLASEMGSTEDDGIGGTGGNLVFDDAILTEVTLNCGEGVALNSETPTAFYIALPPQTFAKGITITATCDDGTALTKATENAITIERNHILPMASIPTQPTPPANEIWYTSSTGNIVTPYKTGVFGATILSNNYENGKGIIKFNGNITEVGYDAFWNCDALTSVTIPNSVTSIGEGAFLGCSKLKSFYGKFASEDNRCLIIDGVLNSFAPAGLTTYTIPNSVTSIGYAAFCDCSALESVTIPNSVTSIGYAAFYGCSALKSFYGKFASEDNRCVIIDGVLHSFAPAGLTTYTIPNSVTSIGYAAFCDCSALESVTIPNSVTSIGYAAFYGCSALKSFYGKFASEDNRCVIIDGVLHSFAPAGLTSYTIPNSVTSIGDYAFEGCYALKSVTIPNSVTEIGDYAFIGCSALTSINIPNSVTEIGAEAFHGCFALTSVTIPNSVTEIGEYAFYYCLALKEVYCEATTPPTGGRNMFSNNASGRKIYVPAASVDAYKAADGWSDYRYYIEPYNFTE